MRPVVVTEAGGPAGLPVSADDEPTVGDPAAETARFPTAMWALIAIVVSSPTLLADIFSAASLENWATIFLSLTLQALPFLALGVAVSAALSALVPATWLARAFPGRPEMVAARFAASLITAIAVGLVWSRLASDDWLEQRLASHRHRSHGRAFVDTAMSDFLQAGGFLVVGAALVATLQTVIPRTALDGVAGGGFFAVLALAALAVVLSICSEADAFVAAGLTQFSLTSRLAFLVVGPMIDLKLIAMHVGAFGRRFALRFDPLTFVTALVVSVIVGALLL